MSINVIIETKHSSRICPQNIKQEWKYGDDQNKYLKEAFLKTVDSQLSLRMEKKFRFIKL